MPTLLQLYSNHQTNKLVTTTVEYTVKQFYLMNRNPFILQMFGSVSAILDTDDTSQYGHAHKVPATLYYIFSIRHYLSDFSDWTIYGEFKKLNKNFVVF